MPVAQIWSDNLGRKLLSSVPAKELARQWGAISAGSYERLCQELLDWAGRDEEVRRWIMHAWREANADLIEAADQVVIEGLTERAVRALDLFVPEDALLAFLTDEFDDGHELARRFLSRVADDGQRRKLLAVLGRLAGNTDEVSRRHVRIVILGGHQRDESKQAGRLFENGPFDVRWRTFQRKPSGGIVQKTVIGLLQNAEAAIIITGMASHMLAQFAKEQAQRSGIRWRCIEKATDNQLKAALKEMFPGLAPDWT
jgi:hypothetical protein